MSEQEKLKILTSDFRKLDEERKGYISELIRKLAEIHCGGEFLGKSQGNKPELQRGIARFYLA